MLGQWEEAAKDLHLASKLDYDEEISIVLKKVGLYICGLSGTYLLHLSINPKPCQHEKRVSALKMLA